MQTSKISLVYFSATNTTKKVMQTIVKQFAGDVTVYDITQNALENEIIHRNDHLLIVGIPVYAGRIPGIAMKSLEKFKGNNMPAVIVCVYGNRDFDDALLELKDTVESNGFKVISAAAFIAQHAIFPKVGLHRPDEKDRTEIEKFGSESATLLESINDINTLQELIVKGNRPYKTPGKIPLKPKGGKKCIACGTCVKLCPAQAISADKPRKTKAICIACGRCIVVCPQNARNFGGLLYKFAGGQFTKANAERKEPMTIYASSN